MLGGREGILGFETVFFCAFVGGVFTALLLAAGFGFAAVFALAI